MKFFRNTREAAPAPEGVRYARWAGHALGIVLLFQAGRVSGDANSGMFPFIQATHFALFGGFLTLNLHSLTNSVWKFVFATGCVLTVLFVFIMIASVMFAYMAAAEVGERLGVPGFEGTLIFVALMQVPALLFQRHPELID